MKNKINNKNIGKYIICIEGIDGCGKDTQLKLLHDLDGFYISSEPNYDTPIGKAIRSILKKEYCCKSDKTIEYLWMADRLEHLQDIKNHVANVYNNINPFVKNLYDFYKKACCITGRYKYSGLVYSECASFTKKLNSKIPDAGLCIILDISPEEALHRINNRLKKEFSNSMDIYENYNKLTNVYNKYKKLKSNITKFVYIDATNSIEDIHDEILHTIKLYIKNL